MATLKPTSRKRGVSSEVRSEGECLDVVFTRKAGYMIRVSRLVKLYQQATKAGKRALFVLVFELPDKTLLQANCEVGKTTNE